MVADKMKATIKVTRAGDAVSPKWAWEVTFGEKRASGSGCYTEAEARETAEKVVRMLGAEA